MKTQRGIEKQKELGAKVFNSGSGTSVKRMKCKYFHEFISVQYDLWGSYLLFTGLWCVTEQMSEILKAL